MATDTMIPIMVEPDATARIAELGMKGEFEQMLEHTRQTVAGLRAIRVTLEYDPCGTEAPGVVIWSHRDDPGYVKDPSDDEFARWKIGGFPPEVCTNILMISVYEVAAHGR